MSLTVDGVWKAGVWAPTVWADGVWAEGGTTPTEVRGTPTENVRGYSWHPRRETEEERAKRIKRAHIRLGIEDAPAEDSAAQVPSQETRGARIAAVDSLAFGLVEPAPSVEDAADATPDSADQEFQLSPEEIEELRLLVRLEMKRRYDAALALILISAAVH